MDAKKMKALVIDALEDIKAKNILMLNVSKLTSLFDYIVVASGDSNRQTKALANNVKEKIKEAGGSLYGSEGEDTGEWVLVDLGDIVVHIMLPVVREYYRLEELWRDGKVEFPKPEPEPEPEPVKEKKAKAPAKARTTGKTVKKTSTPKSTAKKPAATRAKPRTTAKSTPKTSAKATPKAKTTAKSTAKASPKTKATTNTKAAPKTKTTTTKTAAKPKPKTKA